MIEMIFNKTNFKMLFASVVSAILIAIVQTSFVEIANFLPSGIGGLSRLTSMISKQIFNFDISFYVIYFGLNSIIAVLVFKEIGKKFTVFSIINFTLTSILCSKFKPLLSVNDPLLLAIFGGIINGVATGMALAMNLSTGGTDFLNVFFSHKLNKSIINYVLAFNCFIIIVGSFFFGLELGMYSIIYQFTSTQTIKRLHHRYTHETLTIITKYPDDVKNAIFSKVRHGITIFNATGGFKNENESVLYMVVNTFQTNLIIHIVKEIDPHAFINIQISKEVVGNYYQLPLE